MQEEADFATENTQIEQPWGLYGLVQMKTLKLSFFLPAKYSQPLFRKLPGTILLPPVRSLPHTLKPPAIRQIQQTG
jgi:hypothetical protein